MSSLTPNFYTDFSFGNFFYNIGHPMKPLRINILNEMIFSYGLHSFFNFKNSKKITTYEIINFHSMFYLKNDLKYGKKNFEKNKYDIDFFFHKNSNQDCPVFKGILDYCQIYTSASISSASDLSPKEYKYCINWMGGYHHAKKKSASGFCYINDIVLCILELLKTFDRVLYIDIDVHHGDGVEEAFQLSNRVLCVSFHKFKKFFFPETGNIVDNGLGLGKNFSLNIPYKDGIKDSSYYEIYELVISRIVEKFNPDSIVLQAGADSLSGDKLGNFNISPDCHGKCINFVKMLKIPFVILGGGGYKKKNVARCWTKETALLCDKKLDNKIPFNKYSNLFYPSFTLDFPISGVIDKNSKSYLNLLKRKILKNIMKII